MSHTIYAANVLMRLYRTKDYQEIDQPETRIACDDHVC